MSGFVFGTITLKEDYSEEEFDAISWKIFRLGEEYDLFFAFNSNIPQKIIYEMIDE